MISENSMQLQRATCHMRLAVRLMQLQQPEVHEISGELAIGETGMK